MPLLPYHKILESDNKTTSEETMKNMDPQTGAVVSSNLVHGHHVRIGDDKLNSEKESSIAGHSAGFHGTNLIGYQNGPAIKIDVSKMKFSYVTPEIPESIHKVLPLKGPIKKDPPYVITEEDVDSILDVDSGVGSSKYNTSAANNMAFMLYRANTDRSTDNKADWTEFNKFVHKNDRIQPPSLVRNHF